MAFKSAKFSHDDLDELQKIVGSKLNEIGKIVGGLLLYPEKVNSVSYFYCNKTHKYVCIVTYI